MADVREELNRLADILERDGDEHGVGRRLRALASRGVQRFVIDTTEPFIGGGDAYRVESIKLSTGAIDDDGDDEPPSASAFLTEPANGSNQRNMDATAPLGTVCAGVKGGQIAVVAPHLVKMRGDSGGAAADEPMPTITSGAGAARPAGAAHAMGVVTGFLEQANGGNYTGPGSDVRDPQPTICAQGGLQRLVKVHLSTFRQHSTGADACDPLATVSAGGEHHAVVECKLSPEAEAGALRSAAFLMRYYGTGGQHGDLRDPLQTITTKDRLALVTIHVRGVPYVIVDIGMRMLEPRELYLAQGFPLEYIIDRTADGRRLPKHAQVRMVGNSVSPPPLRAIAAANLEPACVLDKAAA